MPADMLSDCAAFAALTDRQQEIEAQLKQVAEEKKFLGERILAEFQRTGTRSVDAGGRRVFLARQLWARLGTDKAAARAALRDAGLGDLVEETVNASRLSAWARELPGAEDGPPKLPDGLDGHVVVSENWQVRCNAR